MSVKLNERLNRALARCRAVWWVVMFAAAFFFFDLSPTWGWLLLFPFAFLSYALLLYITINIVAATTPPEEIAEAEAESRLAKENRAKFEAVASIAERQAKGEDVPTEEVLEALNATGVIEVVKVDEVGPVVGTYMDKNIYEFIRVKMPNRDTIDTLTYFGPARIVDGVHEIPVIDGMIFSCVEGILYSKETEK